jgi:hypothetical protein
MRYKFLVAGGCDGIILSIDVADHTRRHLLSVTVRSVVRAAVTPRSRVRISLEEWLGSSLFCLLCLRSDLAMSRCSTQGFSV